MIFNLIDFKIEKSSDDLDPGTLASRLSTLDEGFYYISIPTVKAEGTGRHALGFIHDKEGIYFLDPNLGIVELKESDKNDIHGISARCFATYSGKKPSELKTWEGIEAALREMGSECNLFKVSPR
ncbi:MAG: hypothetical protein WAM28_04670 [Chlamydiales bacterium]